MSAKSWCADGTELVAGLHLHSALPDALTQSFDGREKSDTTLAFPAVPNVWLITRIDPDGPTEGTSLLDESDYLYPAADGVASGAVCYPVGYPNDDPAKPPFLAKPGDPPFRFMGRCLDETRWDMLDLPHQHLKAVTGYPLTAIGHGDPTFAAYCPNFHGVFGFCDPNPPAPDKTATYYLTGWYSDPDDDFCNPAILNRIFANRLVDLEKARPNTQCQTNPALSLSQHFQWNIAAENDEPCDDLPERTLFFATLTLQPAEAAEVHAKPPDVSVAIGMSVVRLFGPSVALR